MLCSTLPPTGGCLSRVVITDSKKRPDTHRTKVVPKIPSEDQLGLGLAMQGFCLFGLQEKEFS